jgi:hypothetical protein
VQVQRHEIVNLGLNGLQPVTILQTLLYSSHRWDQVRLRLCISLPVSLIKSRELDGYQLVKKVGNRSMHTIT